MSTYLIIGIILIVGIIIVRAYRSLDKLQNDATILVAYMKYAAEGKSSLFDKDKSDEEFYKDKFERIQKACFLLVLFSEEILGKRNDYRFQIRENGPTFGVFVTVNVGQFISAITGMITKIIDTMPLEYQSSLKNYLKQPYSPENRRISKEIEEKLWPQKTLKKEWALKLHKNIIDTDYLYTIFK